MSKVFRLFNIQGNNNITDWQASQVYGSQAISEITDPDGADAKKEVTSIPSPFARIDLIKTAFREVVNMANKKQGDKEFADFDGKTIYHRMVSDALDVGEIFFNFNKLKDKFEIIIWDRNKDLNTNNVLGKTLKRYLDSDSKGDDPYNFKRLDRFYLLNYIGPDKPSSLNIVGATSPATLFFSSANNLSYVSKNVIFGSDRPFDINFQPLYKRDFEYQKYLYAFRLAYGENKFHKDFPEFDDYLTSKTGKLCNYRYLTQQQKEEIDKLDANSYQQYENIKIGSNGEDTLKILGQEFHQKSTRRTWKSQFEIDSKLYITDNNPLVLPVESGSTYEKLIYTTDVWGTENKAPYFDKPDWMNRRLPIVNDSYSYLTISDFLTDTIVRMPYNLNADSYFNGNYNGTNDSYLLPLTTTFFKFFDVQALQTFVAGSKKMFELIDIAGGVKAILRIPIKGNNQIKFVEYSRTYFEANQPDIEHNDGALIEKKIGMGILPLVKFPENVKKHYRIALFDKGPRDLRLVCYKENEPITEIAHITREAKNLDLNECSKEAYVINDNFDRIQISVGDACGVIIPKFKPVSGNRIYTFAVDFGTTNTHIEYSYVTSINEPNSVANSFDITLKEKQLHRLHRLYADRDINGAFEHNFLPDTISDNDEFQFPMRTVFSEWIHNDRKQKNYALANGNIPFLYEKEIFPESYNEARTELKWSGEDEYPLVKMYLENIFIMISNKVIMNGGKLDLTKIIWFYPASMDTARVDEFNLIWTNLYNEYLGGNPQSNLIAISESTAPYRYYRRKKGAKGDVVTIDVGGGTTDVFIVEDSNPKMLLSFLFASNAVFGDGYNWDSDNNGFINLYFDKFIEVLNSCNQPELAFTLKQIEAHKKSSDIIVFLFSLLSNKKVAGNDSLDFPLKLAQNRKLKYVFIVFYSAILYYIAMSMKSKGLKQPLTIAFSGNGSKTLRILSANNNTIGTFTKLIFDKVYGESGNKLDVIFEEEPKKATCKGGILDPIPQTPTDIKKIKLTNIGDNFSKTDELDRKIKYEDITLDMQEKIVENVLSFIDFLFELHETNEEYLIRSLGADDSIIELVKSICTDKTELSESLKSALKAKKSGKVVEETLFFYPLIGVLHKLTRELS